METEQRLGEARARAHTHAHTHTAGGALSFDFWDTGRETVDYLQIGSSEPRRRKKSSPLHSGTWSSGPTSPDRTLQEGEQTCLCKAAGGLTLSTSLAAEVIVRGFCSVLRLLFPLQDIDFPSRQRRRRIEQPVKMMQLQQLLTRGRYCPKQK